MELIYVSEWVVKVRRNNAKPIVCISFIILIIILIGLFYSPPPQYTREKVLEITPLGMSMEDVILCLKNSYILGYHYINEEYGYTISGTQQPWQLSTEQLALIDKDTIIGTKSIGGYFIDSSRKNTTDTPRVYGKMIFWGFDEDLKLIEVSVCGDEY